MKKGRHSQGVRTGVRTGVRKQAVILLKRQPPLSFAVIGRHLGVTKEYIRQISNEEGTGSFQERRENR